MSAARRDRGAVLPIVALVLPVLILMTAFAVDLGRQRSLRRDMQAGADVIALDLTRIIPVAQTQPTAAETLTALNASLTRNGMSTVTAFANEETDGVKVQWGTWTPPTSGDQCPRTIVTAPPDCFAAGTLPVNAVRVTLSDELDYFFQPGTGRATRSAIAALGDEPSAEFLMGSTLVSMNPASNAILGQVLNSVAPNASLIGYQGLANAQVTLGDLALALGAGSVDELMGMTVTYEDLVVASADALQAQGGSAAGVTALDQLVGLGIQDVDVQMGDLLGAGNMSTDAGLDSRVSIPQLLLAGVGIADGTHTITIPGTSLSIPGLASVTLQLNLIEGAIRVGTFDGASGTTKQVDLGVRIDLGVSGDKSQRVCQLPSNERTILGQLLGPIFQLVNCLLAPLTERVLDVDLAGSIDLALTASALTGTQDIKCDVPQLDVAYGSNPATVRVTNASIAANVTFGGNPLTLLGVTVPPSTPLQTTTTPGTVSFVPTDAGPRHLAFAQKLANGTLAGPTARVGSPNLGLSNLLQLNGLDVKVVNTNLPAIGAIAENLVQPTLNAIVAQVDQIVVSEVSRLLGLNLGGGDITPQWMECDENSVRLVG
jgi:uncharacterized membrane protein